MLLFIILAILLSRIKGYSCKVLLREWSLLPLWIVELLYRILQICILCGNYRFIRYSAVLQGCFILALVPAIVRYNLTKPAFAGVCMILSGTFMNKAVMQANHGAMPIYPTLSAWTGYYTPNAIRLAEDTRHILMSANTKLNGLGDYIDIGFSIMSPGDLLIHGFTTLILYSVIKALNEKSKED